MTIAASLKAIVGVKGVLTSDSDKAYASIDRSTNVAESMPFLVVKVGTVLELTEVVQCCIHYRTPLVIRAAGTGKSGGAVADQHSVLIDTSGLNQIVTIDTKKASSLKWSLQLCSMN